MNRRLWFLVAAVALGLIMASNARWQSPRATAIEPSTADTPSPSRTGPEAGPAADPAHAPAPAPTPVPVPTPAQPATPGESAPPAPGADYVWVDGHWVWHDHERKFEWEPGYWRRLAPVFIADGTVRQDTSPRVLLRVEHFTHAPQQGVFGEGLLQERHLGL